MSERIAQHTRSVETADTRLLEPKRKYSRVAIVLHWLMAALILVLLGLGWFMGDLPDGPDRSWYFALHKSLGLTVALLLVGRMAWLVTHPRPPFPAAMPRWQASMARGNFIVLYLLMILQPLSGYLSSSFSGYKTRYFGIPLPHWGWKEPVLNELLTSVHVISSRLLVAFLLLHLLGASVHLFVRRDGGFRRMWF